MKLLKLLGVLPKLSKQVLHFNVINILRIKVNRPKNLIQLVNRISYLTLCRSSGLLHRFYIYWKIRHVEYRFLFEQQELVLNFLPWVMLFVLLLKTVLNCRTNPRIELTKKEWIAPIVEIVIYSRKGFKTWTNIFIIIIEKSYKKLTDSLSFNSKPTEQHYKSILFNST